MCVCVCVSEEYVSEVNFTSSEDSSESQSRLGKEIPPDTEGPCRCLSMCVFVSQVKRALLMLMGFFSQPYSHHYFISVLIYQDHFMVFSFVIAMHFASKEIQAFAEISLKLYAMASSC